MKLLIDMNLSPKWVSVLKEAGFESTHWSSIGRLDIPDYEILTYAKSKGYVIFMHDLDFRTILAATKADCPSVIQVRTQNVTPDCLEIQRTEQRHSPIGQGRSVCSLCQVLC